MDMDHIFANDGSDMGMRGGQSTHMIHEGVRPPRIPISLPSFAPMWYISIYPIYRPILEHIKSFLSPTAAW